MENHQTDLAARVLSKTKVFTDLEATPEWQAFKELVLEPRLLELERQIVTIDRRSEDWREVAARKIEALQEARFLFDSLFAINQAAETEARKTMTEAQAGT